MRVVQHSDDRAPLRPVTAIDQLPLVLTVEEAAAVLRISRASAYEQARIWRETGGETGLPVVVLGRSLRVLRAQVERLLGLDESEPPPPAFGSRP